MPMNDGDSISINLGKKGYTYLGVLMVFMMLAATGIGGYFIINNDPSVGTVRGAEKVWSQSDPIETQLFSPPGEPEQTDTVIEEHQENANSGWKKTEGGKVFWENPKGYIEVDPHTCTSFHCVHNIKIKNKDTVDHSLNFAFIFPDNAKNPRFYRLESIEKTRATYHTVEHSEWIEANQSWNNYTTVEENGTETYTTEEYIDRSSVFESTVIDGQKVYYTTSVSFIAESMQHGRFEYDLVPVRTNDGFHSTGKWEMYVWKGNYQNPTWSIMLDPWFNTSFNRRQVITISNQQATELLNYQIGPEEGLNVTFDGDMLDNFADLRFTWNNTTSGDEQSIDHWVQNNVSSTYADVWIELPQIRSSLNETVYMYYDNNTPVSDESNGNDTFLWFDDFEDNNITDWDTANSPSMVTNTTTPAQGIYALTCAGDNAGSDSQCIRSLSGFLGNTQQIMLHYMTRETVFSGSNLNLRGSGSTTEAGIIDNVAFEFKWSGGATEPQIATKSSNVWYKMEFMLDLANDNASARINNTFHPNSNYGTTAGVTSITSLAITNRASDQGKGDWDVFYIRNFTGHYDNQPTATFGAEEFQFGWDIDLDAPTNGFSNGTVDGNTTFFATPLNVQNSTAFIINATLYSNVSGTFESRASNTSELLNNTQFNITDIEYPDGIYIWNMELCAEDGEIQCIFGGQNFTYTVESTPPTIQIQQPTGEFNQNSSIPLNVTAQGDGNPIDQTWYNIDDGNNITFTPNTTITVAAQGNHTLKAFANKTTGLEAFNTTNFSWIGTSNYTVRGEDFNRILGGATILLLNSSYNTTLTTAINSIYIDEDKFDSINTTTWPGPNSGATAANTCGFVVGPSSLVLDGPSATLTSDGFDLSDGGYIEFYVKRGTGLGSCGLPNGSVFFQYSTDGGSAWTNITEFADDNTTFTDNFGFFQTEVPAGAETTNTTFRFVTASSIAAGETWAVDVVTIRENGGLAQIRWDELPQGSVTQNISLDGYVTNESTRTIDEFTLFNDTVDLDYAGLDISVFDEQTTAELTFNMTISTESNSKDLLNLTGANLNIKQLLLMEGEATLSLSADGYATRDITTTLSTTTKPVIEAFLIEEAASVDATISVQQTLTEDPVEGATIEVKKVIGGILTTVATLETDSTGSVTIALDPTVTYTLVMTFEDETQTATFKPTGVSPSFTFSISGDATTAPPTTFSNFFWRMLPRTSFVIMQNDTGAINLTTGSPAEDLEFFKLTLTYNGTEIFSETNTTAAGGDIDGIFNMTDALNLSTRWSVEQNIRENGETNVVTAKFEYKRNSTIGGDDVSSVEQTITKNYRLTDNVRGLFNILTSIEASEMSKGLMWMILVMIVVIGLSMVTGFNTLVAGIGVLTMVAGVIVGWLPFWPTVGIAIIAMLGLVMMRGRN